MSYKLISGIARAVASPNTFSVPTDEDRRAVKPGDSVQLMFSSTHPVDWVERMWVTVNSAEYPNYRGTLANQPCQPDAFGLTHGAVVTFHASHIINWLKAAA